MLSEERMISPGLRVLSQHVSLCLCTGDAIPRDLQLHPKRDLAATNGL